MVRGAISITAPRAPTVGGSGCVRMNVEQRVLTALRCEKPDRVPVLVYLNPYVEDWYSHLPSYAEVLSAAQQLGDVVFDWVFPAPFMFTTGHRWIEQRDLGNGQTEHIIHTPDGPITEVTRAGWRGHEVIKRWIATPEDAQRALSIPYVPCKPDLETFFSTKIRLADRAVAQISFQDPVGLLDWIDEQTLTKWRMRRRDLIRQLIETAFDRVADGLKTCLQASVGSLYALRSSAVPAMRHLSPEECDEFVIEHHARLAELIHRHEECYLVIQSCGRLGSLVDRLANVGIDGLEVVDPPLGGDVDLGTLKRRVGEHVCLIANLPYEILRGASTAEIERQVEQTLATASHGGGLILSPCPATPDRDLPPQASSNFIHYLKTAHEKGRYGELR